MMEHIAELEELRQALVAGLASPSASTSVDVVNAVCAATRVLRESGLAAEAVIIQIKNTATLAGYAKTEYEAALAQLDRPLSMPLDDIVKHCIREYYQQRSVRATANEDRPTTR